MKHAFLFFFLLLLCTLFLPPCIRSCLRSFFFTNSYFSCFYKCLSHQYVAFFFLLFITSKKSPHCSFSRTPLLFLYIFPLLHSLLRVYCFGKFLEGKHLIFVDAGEGGKTQRLCCSAIQTLCEPLFTLTFRSLSIRTRKPTGCSDSVSRQFSTSKCCQRAGHKNNSTAKKKGGR